ncbi:MAG: c-type cytochrome [Pseudomonadota bacterium]
MQTRDWALSRFALCRAPWRGVLAAVAAQWAFGAAAAPLEAALASIPTDEIGSHAALARQAVAMGKKVYRAHCANCHGVNLKGVAGRHAPDLGDRAVLYGSDNVDADPDQIFPSDIETTIRYGIRASHPKTRKLAVMPSFAGLVPGQEGGFPVLSAREIGDLVEYLTGLQGRKADGPAMARGKLLFEGGGGCFDCHGRNGKGNPGIGATDLTSAHYLYGNERAAMVASIRQGRQGSMPAYENTLTAGEIKAAAYFLHTVQSQARR